MLTFKMLLPRFSRAGTSAEMSGKRCANGSMKIVVFPPPNARKCKLWSMRRGRKPVIVRVSQHRYRPRNETTCSAGLGDLAFREAVSHRMDSLDEQFLSSGAQKRIYDARAAWRNCFGNSGHLPLAAHRKLEGEDPMKVALCLASLAEIAADDTCFSLREVLEGAPKLQECTVCVQMIRDAVAQDEVQRALQPIRDAVAGAAATLGVADVVDDYLGDTKIGDLLDSAELELDQLQIHQFSRGLGDRGSFRLNEWVYTADTPHDLLCALACQKVDGLTLCAIIDRAVAEYSYFVWALRAGGALILLTEQNGLACADQKHMRRNPGRDFERRYAERFYPKSMFSFRETRLASGGGRQSRISGFQDAPSYALKRPSGRVMATTSLKSLEGQEVAWVLLVAYLLYDKYWSKEEAEAELSTTVQSFGNPDLLRIMEHSADGPGLLPPPTGNTETPAGIARTEDRQLEHLRLGELCRFGKNGSNWEGPADVGGRTGCNDWMVDRYGSSISPEILENPGSAVQVAGETLTDLRSFRESGCYGTIEELRRQRLYLARSNQARVIEALANEEFRAEADNILAWFRERIRINLPLLKAAIAAGELMVDHKAFVSGFENSSRMLSSNILHGAEHCPVICRFEADCHGGRTVRSAAPRTCLENGTKTQIQTAYFIPEEANGVARLTGLDRSALPDVLHEWTKDMTRFYYLGNPILGRIDPVERLKNPWSSLQFCVRIHYSATALKRWQQGVFRENPNLVIESTGVSIGH